jgi:Flp pilus assembly protein TadB
MWRLIGWLVLALVHRRVALAGDAERRHAEATLREGYAGGYITLDELSRRTGRVQSARSRSQLRRSLLGLPRIPVAASIQDVVLVVVTGAYVVFTLALALILGVALLLGASISTFVVFALVWLVPTWLYVRFRRAH